MMKSLVRALVFREAFELDLTGIDAVDDQSTEDVIRPVRGWDSIVSEWGYAVQGKTNRWIPVFDVYK